LDASNLLDRLTRITEKPEKILIKPLGIVISKTEVDLIVDAEKQPLLYGSIPPQAISDNRTIKRVRVKYPKKFARKVRRTKTKGWEIKDKKRGCPGHGCGWMKYSKRGGEGDCTCGRLYQGRRGKANHINPKGDIPTNCEVYRLQQGRTRCYFRLCKPLMELKGLIHPIHLQDSGLQPEEIKAFRWPVVQG